MINKNLRLEGVRILFRNFKGEERKYNRAGARNFCAVVPEKQAETLEEEGWPIRWLEPKREGDERVGLIKISISYKNANNRPTIVMVTGEKKTKLDEEAIECLDSAEIENVDLIARPYNWEINGKTGVSAYLKTGYFTILEDDFYKKYYGDDSSDMAELDDEVPF